MYMCKLQCPNHNIRKQSSQVNCGLVACWGYMMAAFVHTWSCIVLKTWVPVTSVCENKGSYKISVYKVSSNSQYTCDVWPESRLSVQLQHPVWGWYRVLGEIVSGCLECTSMQIVGKRGRGYNSSKLWSCYTWCSSFQTSYLQDTYRTVWLPDPYLQWWRIQVEWKNHFQPHRFYLHILSSLLARDVNTDAGVTIVLCIWV